jgi:hypothetical protein
MNARDIAEAVSAIDRAMRAIIDGHGHNWMDIAGDLSLSRAVLLRALADVTVAIKVPQ